MKVRNVLNNILEMFKTGNLPEAVAFSVFPPMDIPSNSWSFINRLIMVYSGTHDARGYRQWREVGRHVKKGAKAINILAPRFQKRENDETEDYYLIGFLSVPVFRVEDTDGEPLEYQKNTLPEFPLMEKAKEWGIEVKAVPGGRGYYGAYNGSEIKLAAPEEIVFFHELSHHAHKLVLGELKPGQDWKQEIVAELSAQALCCLVGKKPDDTMGNTYQYIERYSKKAEPPLTPITACLQVLGEVEQVLNLIMDKEDTHKEAVSF